MRIVIVLTILCIPALAKANGVMSGEQIVAQECSACHAIGKTGNSPNPKSPPFRDIIKRYPAENLVEALAEGIVTGHNDMPEFMFEPDEVTAIVGYLESLRGP
jgi:cytochrome c